MAESVKVDADAFKNAIRALLNTPPERIADIPRTRDPHAKKPGPSDHKLLWSRMSGVAK